MKNIHFSFTAFYLCLGLVQSANVLGVFGVTSFSHQIVYQKVWKELSLRGHQVTVLTTEPLNDPKLINYTELNLRFAYDVMEKMNFQKMYHKDLPMSEIIANYYEMYGNIFEAELAHPTLQMFIQNTSRRFDVMLVEFLHPLLNALSVKFNCPMIGISSYNTLLPGHDAVGNPSHPVLNPDMLLQIEGSLGFFDRIYSFYFSLWIRYHHYYYVIPKYDKIARKYIANDLPYLGDIEKNVNLLFLNVNPVLHSIRPNVPAVIELGHIDTKIKKPLPIDLQKELDNAKKGAVYFSLGSTLKSVNFSQDIQQTIIEAFTELPYKIFWKWEGDHLPKQPRNVIIKKWFPQHAVLEHPNMKVFLTHCGLHSMEEAIFHTVPLVAMPVCGDQPLNAKKAVKLGIGQFVNFETMNKQQLKEALIEVAENPIYRRNAKKVSDLINIVPMTGLEKAVWWTEYVIRHKGARHLRNSAIDMPWYQYFLLDVFAFIIVITLVVVYIAYFVVSIGIKTCRKLFNQT